MKTVSKKNDLKRIIGMFEKAMVSLGKFVSANSVKNVSAKRMTTKNVTPKKVSEKRVCAISKNNRKRYFKNLTECSKALSIDSGNMSKAIRGKRKSAGGYRFEYVD